MDIKSIQVGVKLPRWWKPYLYACGVFAALGFSMDENRITSNIVNRTRFVIRSA